MRVCLNDMPSFFNAKTRATHLPQTLMTAETDDTTPWYEEYHNVVRPVPRFGIFRTKAWYQFWYVNLACFIDIDHKHMIPSVMCDGIEESVHRRLSGETVDGVLWCYR